MEPKILYLRGSNKNYVGCLAFQVNDEDDSIRIAGSLCSEEDHFNKTLARSVAEGRLLQKKWPSHEHAYSVLRDHLKSELEQTDVGMVLHKILRNLNLTFKRGEATNEDYVDDIVSGSIEKFSGFLNWILKSKEELTKAATS